MRSRVNVESVIGANDDYSVSDGSKSYRSAIEVHLGGARHVLDRFHVVRWFTDALTLVRRDLQRR
jgi:transposase